MGCLWVDIDKAVFATGERASASELGASYSSLWGKNSAFPLDCVFTPPPLAGSLFPYMDTMHDYIWRAAWNPFFFELDGKGKF